MADIEFKLGKDSGRIHIDWSIILIAALLTAAGLISVYSATHIYSESLEETLSSVFVRQTIYAGLGFFVMLAVMLLPQRWIEMNSLLFYAAAIAMLILVLFLGKETYGTKGWLSLGFFSVQPAEIAKLASIMLAGQHLARKGTDIRNLRDLGVISGIFVLPFALVMMQPDVGSASVLLVIFIGILFWSGFDSFLLYGIVATPLIVFFSLFGQSQMVIAIVLASAIALIFRRRIVITSLIIGFFIAAGLAAPLAYDSLMPHQQARIDTFLNPDNDPRGMGYNVIQSKLAIGSGGLTGKGFLQGTQTQLRYIPKQWTDFIFSVPSEEFGFIGSVAVVVLMTLLILRSIRIGSEVDDHYPSLVAVGIGVMFMYHFIINIGMAIGLMPVMGIPLPFMSAGGTSLIVNMTAIGLLLNFHKTKKSKR